MRIKVLSEDRLAALRRHPTVYRWARRLRFSAGRFVPPIRLAGIPGRVHPNDFTLYSTEQTGREGYAEGAANVLAVIDEALRLAGKDMHQVARWLDFGCGYGRVLRYLVERVPPERVWVTDVLPEAVRFCAKEFGVNIALDLPGDADLCGSFHVIYAISVLTHATPEGVDELADLLSNALAPGGLLVLTTHGPWSLENHLRFPTEFAGKHDQLRDELIESGTAFIPYVHSRDASYGLTWHTPQYIKTLFENSSTSLESLTFERQGLDGFQDVYVFQRRP